MSYLQQGSEFCNQFYRTYFLTTENEIFAVLTDTFHKPGFKLHVLVLQHLFCLVLCHSYSLFCFFVSQFSKSTNNWFDLSAGNWCVN